ncbi:hypothetical protein Tco_0932012 [Tanacetum coccineum]
MDARALDFDLKGEDIEAYKKRFHELVLMCPKLVSTKKKKIEKYIRGFPEGIKGNVTSSKPATLHDAINMARELIEQGVRAKAIRIGDINKREVCNGTSSARSCPPRLKRSRIPLVKVRWNSRRGPEFTWEREDQFRKKYPHLFTKTAPSSSAAS